MARMSDFHVVGDPRFAPDVPSGGGGVSQEYVDSADINVKKTAAKGHNAKYDESVIPSQYTNKLYVYGNPESMYKASEQGESGEGFFDSGNVVIHHHNDWVWGDVSNTTYRRYDDAYKGLAIVKTTPPYATEAQILDKFYAYMIVAGDGTQLVIADNNVLASVNGWSFSHSTVERDDGYTQGMFNFSAYDAIPTHSLPYPQAPDFWNGILFVSAMLPVFDLDTQAGVDTFNTYQTTGDYSGAINYSDLNPLSPDSFVAIDVISGDWYVIVNDEWVKQGTLALNSSGGGASNLSDLSDVELTNLSDGQILQYNSTTEKWENADNQGSLPFEFVIDPNDNGINIVYDDSILNGGE